MKTRIKLTVGVIALILSVSACKKNNESDDTMSSAAMVASLSDQANSDFLAAATVTGGTETEAYAVTNDGLPDSYAMNDSCMRENETRPNDRGKRFHDGVHKVNLTDDQKAQIKAAMVDFTACKKPNVESFRAAVKDLLVKYEDARNALVANLNDSTITIDQFHEQMKANRIELVASIQELKHARASEMKSCFETLLNKLKDILGDDFVKFARHFKHA